MSEIVTLYNDFHGTKTTIRVRPDSTISAATYRRAARKLCRWEGCRCGVPDVLNMAQPVYQGCRIVAWKLAPREARA